jgi:Tfp pilus assembly protein PilO
MKYLKMFSELSLGKVIVLAIFVAAGYYASYFDAGESIEAEYSNLKSQVDERETRRVEIAKTMKKEEEMMANTLQLKRNLDVVKDKIPNELKDTQMQTIINEAANNSGVSVVSLNVDSQGKRDPDAPPVEMTIEEVKPENLIEEIKFSIRINGTFDAFIRFLETLAKEDKVIKIRNFNITQFSTNVDEDKIVFNGEIIGFKQAKIKIINRTQ